MLGEDKMHLIDQVVLSVVILVPLGALVIVKQLLAGSVLDKPKGNLLVQLVFVITAHVGYMRYLPPNAFMIGGHLG
jgi:hypothetical protein